MEPILNLATGLGLRQGELLGLDWTDIDFEKRQLSVRRQLQRVAGKLQRVELKTPSSRRTLSIPAFVVDTLRVQQARQENDRSLAVADWTQTGSVFTTHRGTHLEARNMLRDYEKLRKRVGLSDVRFHDLRHGCATLLLMKGVSMKVLQEILGHGSFATTANVYSHVLPEMSRDAADKMDQVFDSMAVNQPGKIVN